MHSHISGDIMNSYILSLINSWLSQQVSSLLNIQRNGYDGSVLAEVTIEPNKHPHYDSSKKYCIHHNGDCFVMDYGCSGSPSCWNWYEAPKVKDNKISEDIYDMFMDIKDACEENKTMVTFFNEGLEEVFRKFVEEEGEKSFFYLVRH